jgi:hypothetical protein
VRVAIAVLALTAIIAAVSGASASRSASGAACPRVTRDSGYQPDAVAEILRALRREIPRVLSIHNMDGRVDLSRPENYSVDAAGSLGYPQFRREIRTPAARRCGDRVADRTWFAWVSVPKAAAADFGTYWLYLVYTRRGWHVWYAYCPNC